MTWVPKLNLRGPQGNVGPRGFTGDAGLSAYEVAVQDGFVGGEAAWLASLVGDSGPAGEQGIPGPVGGVGPAGDSAYTVAVQNGFVGNQAAWLASLVGAQGIQGPAGEGLMFTWNGTQLGVKLESDPSYAFTNLLGPTGNTGATGASAYEVAVADGFIGTEEQWLESLVGPKGDPGDIANLPDRLQPTGGSITTAVQLDATTEAGWYRVAAAATPWNAAGALSVQPLPSGATQLLVTGTNPVGAGPERAMGYVRVWDGSLWTRWQSVDLSDMLMITTGDAVLITEDGRRILAVRPSP